MKAHNALKRATINFIFGKANLSQKTKKFIIPRHRAREGGAEMKCWYAKAKKKERSATKAALVKFMEQVHEEVLKEKGEKAAEENQKESEEENPND